MSDKEKLTSWETAGSQPLEDRALKGAAKLFGAELMPLVGIRGKVRRIAPTEQVHLNPRDFMEDFNYEMTDGSWTHLEFESKSIRAGTLRRFRAYEAVTSEQYGVDVTTCVICTSGVRKLKHSLVTGINTYRVKVIRMKDRDADRTIRKLERKQEKGRLKRSDLLEVLLTPLMSGQMPQQERITRGIRLLKSEREHAEQEELAHMEAVLYTFAMKFLDDRQLKEIKEEMDMTILGEMILRDGMEKGMKEGGARINRLNKVLINANRYDDLKRATEDSAFQEQLMKELFPEEP